MAFERKEIIFENHLYLEYKIEIEIDQATIECFIKQEKNDSLHLYYKFNIPEKYFFLYEGNKYISYEDLSNIDVDSSSKDEIKTILKQFIVKNVTAKAGMNMLNNILLNPKMQQFILIFSLLLSFIVRYFVSFGKYSGYHNAPEFGDYEAQRHWMELTTNTPPKEWYIETPNNNLSEWRMDYPPLTAYHSYLIGLISKEYESESMELKKSRGYETDSHKRFMRYSVFISDLIFYIGVVLCLFAGSKYNSSIKNLLILLSLIVPGLILVDHGHFQYNCVMHGLALVGAYYCSIGKIYVGSVFFTAALNFKQMGLYFAFPFFFYILGQIKSKSNNVFQFVIQLCFTGLSVILTMCLLWIPWLDSLQSALNVVKAIFPVHRGLFQLQVASFWYVTNGFIKWVTYFKQDSLVTFALILTLLAALPSNLFLLLRPKKSIFFLNLLITSIAFFLFSYHVHEKTILIPIVALILNYKMFGYYIFDFVLISSLTLNQLIVTYDGLFREYYVTNIIFIFFGMIIFRILHNVNFFVKFEEEKLVCGRIIHFMDWIYFKILRYFIYITAIVLSFSKNYIKHPTLWPFMCASLGFVMFGYVYLRGVLLVIFKYMKKAKKSKIL